MRIICLFALGLFLTLGTVNGVRSYERAMIIQSNSTRYPSRHWVKICNSSKHKAINLRNFLKENVDLLYL